MDKYPIQLREKVDRLIGEMEKCAYLFSKSGEKDFTRKRKIPFSQVIKSLIYMGGQSLNRELLDVWRLDQSTPTVSAFIQQRSKLSEDAFPFLFKELNEMFPGNRDIDGYRILACDGSDLHYAANPADTACYFRANEHSKGYNLLHLNALYDLQSKRYVDAILQPRRNTDEIGAFISMIDRFEGDEKTIFTADRGYESYNVLAHIQERGMKYVLRIKKPSSSGILQSLHLQENCTFDLAFSYFLTKKQTNFVKQDRSQYHILPKESRFDFCDLHHTFYYGTFILNPAYTIYTDVDRLEGACKRIEASAKTESKKRLYECLISLYKGGLLASHETNSWLLPKATYYQNRYIQYLKKYIDLLNVQNDYFEIQRVAVEALAIDGRDGDIHYSLINAILDQGNKSVARVHYKRAEQYLSDEQKEELQARF